jgi:hypothetical protein
MNNKYCFSLVCAADLEEKVLDLLLANFGNEIFISLPTFSHGTAPGRLSALEQVLGRSHSVYIQILLTDEQTESLRHLLHAEFAGTGIRYWASPLGIEGEVA